MPSFKSMMTMLASFLSSFFDLAAALLPFEPKRSWWREPYLMRDAIGRCTQKRGEAIKSHQEPSSAIKRHHAPSSAIKRRTGRQTSARNQEQLRTIKSHHKPASAVPDAKPVLDDDVREPLLVHEDECLPNKATHNRRRESEVRSQSQGLTCP